MWKFLALPCIAFLLTGCFSNSFQAKKDFDASCWNYQDSLNWSYQAEASAISPVFTLGLEENYGYSNIYLRLKVVYPSGKDTVLRRTQTFIDPLGNWTVPPEGGVYQINFTAFDDFSLSETGSYQFTLWQDMREDDLCSVSWVGVAALP